MREEFSKQKFDVYYMDKIFPLLAEQELVRQKYLKKFYLLLSLAIILLPLSIKGYLWLEGRQHTIDPGFIFVPFVFLIAYLYNPISSYRSDIKEKVMEIFAGFFGSFVYREDAAIDESLLSQSKLFGYYNRHYSDDSFDGTFDDVKIKIFEEELRRVSGSGKRRTDIEVFDGIIVCLEMNKKFQGQTLVVRDRGIFNGLQGYSGMERVKLEDVVFEKEFEVYSTNQIEARYLLTTAFMERILRLKAAYHAKRIEFSFFGKQLMIALYLGKNMFEICSLFRNAASRDMLDEAFEQFSSILEIIEILKLNQKTGL